MMSFLTLEDLYGQFEVIAFPNVLETHARLLALEQPVWVEGRISVKEEEVPKILADRFLALTLDGPLPNPASLGRNGSSGYGFPRASRDLAHESGESYASGTAAAGKSRLTGNPPPEKSMSGNPPPAETQRLKVRIPLETAARDRVAVHALLRYFDGIVPAYVYENGSKSCSDRCAVDNGTVLVRALVQLLGIENVKMETS